MTTATAGEEPEDPNWRFDPKNPPERFTRAMLGRMSIAHLRMCADPERSPLDESQQASFDEAYAELNRDVSKHIETALQAMAPRVNFKWPTPKIDLSAFAPKVDFNFPTNLAYASLDELTRASFERIQRNLTAHLETARSISVPEATQVEPPSVVPEAEYVPGSPEGPEPSDVKAEPDSGLARLQDVTPDKLLGDFDEDVNQLTLLSNVVELLREQSALMQEQQKVVERQQDSVARGAVFYVVVGLGSALSGIATVVGLGDGSDVVLSLVLLSVVAAIAWLAYWLRPGQRKEDDKG